MQRLSNYKDYVITTSVVVSPGRPCEASFVISVRTAGAATTVIHTERLAKTFAYGGDARAAATQAAQACIDGMGPLR